MEMTPDEKKKDEEMGNYYGARILITHQVKYVGEGDDPSEDPYMKSLENAYKLLEPILWREKYGN